MPAPSTAKTSQAIQRLIENEDYYSGQMKARSTVARLVAKSSEYDGKAQEAAELLFNAASTLLQKGQQGSGTDLALYLIEVWTQTKVSCGDQQRGRICQLIGLCGRSGSWRNDMINASVSWSAKNGGSPPGDAQLHTYVGELLYKERDYVPAEKHFVAAPTRDSARKYAHMLYDWSLLDGHKVDGSGRYAARGVLSYLQNGNILPAHMLLDTFLHKLIQAQPALQLGTAPLPATLASSPGIPSSELLITALPSLNFLQLTILAAQVGAGAPSAPGPGKAPGGGRNVWTQVCNRYEREVTWLQTQEVKQSREVLGQMWFGIQPAGRQGNDLMSNLMGSLFGGGGGGGGGGGRRTPAGQQMTQPGLD